MIADAYENREYSKAMREIMILADKANQYIDHHKPWVIAKQENRDDELQSICTTGIKQYYKECTSLQAIIIFSYLLEPIISPWQISLF